LSINSVNNLNNLKSFISDGLTENDEHNNKFKYKFDETSKKIIFITNRLTKNDNDEQNIKNTPISQVEKSVKNLKLKSIRDIITEKLKKKSMKSETDVTSYLSLENAPKFDPRSDEEKNKCSENYHDN